MRAGLLEGDSTRRNTAIALTKLKLKVVPHETFRVMLLSDPLLQVHPDLSLVRLSSGPAY